MKLTILLAILFAMFGVQSVFAQVGEMQRWEEKDSNGKVVAIVSCIRPYNDQSTCLNMHVQPVQQIAPVQTVFYHRVQPVVIEQVIVQPQQDSNYHTRERQQTDLGISYHGSRNDSRYSNNQGYRDDGYYDDPGGPYGSWGDFGVYNDPNWNSSRAGHNRRYNNQRYNNRRSNHRFQIPVDIYVHRTTVRERY